MHITVRPATEADIPVLMDLWWEMMDFHARVEPRFHVLPQPEAKQAWEKHLREDVWNKGDWRVLVAEADGQVAGMMIGMLRDTYPVFEPQRYGYVTDVVVDPAVRRSGVGQALFEAAKDWFRAQGVSHLRLMVAHNNPTSQAFWRAMGCTNYMEQMWYDLEAK